MADAAGGVKPVQVPLQVKALARLRRERERRALQELHALRGRQADAEQARETADCNLETEKSAQRTGEQQIYRSLPDAGPLPPDSLERYREAIRRLSARVDEAAYHLDAATAVLFDARQAVEAGRTHLTRRMRDSHKWQQIETRVQSSHHLRLQMMAERESDDDTELRYGRSS
jgi:hypothetical protein